MTSSSRAAGTGRPVVAAHLVWEALLLVGAAVVWFLAYHKVSSNSAVFTQLLVQLVLIGLPAAAIGLSLRTATPNVAAGAIAGGAGLMAAKLITSGWSFWPAAGVAVVAGLGVGLVGALVVGLLDVSGWVASFAVIAAVQVVALASTPEGELIAVHGGGVPQYKTFFNVLAAVFIVASIGGGVLWLSGGLRRAVGADRVDGERRSLGFRLFGACVGFGGASAIAALAGVAVVVQQGAASPSFGFALPLLALGAALLGGASVHGGRGGIAGTVLASAVLAGVTELALLNNAHTWLSLYLPAAAAVALGIGLSALFRALESGRSQPTGYPATGQPYPGGPSGYAPGTRSPYGSFGSAATLADRDSTDALPTLEQ